MLITASCRVTPFAWDESITVGTETKQNTLFKMAKYYNILNGYTFLLHDHCDNLAVLSIIMDKYCDNNMESTISDHKNDLQMLLLTAHDKLMNLYHEENNADNVSTHKSKISSQTEKMKFSIGQALVNLIKKSLSFLPSNLPQ